MYNLAPALDALELGNEIIFPELQDIVHGEKQTWCARVQRGSARARLLLTARHFYHSLLADFFLGDHVYRGHLFRGIGARGNLRVVALVLVGCWRFRIYTPTP